MIKVKTLSLLSVAMSLISVISIMLIFYVSGGVPKLSETVVIKTDGIVEENLTIDGLTINPGEKRESVVFLKSEIGGKFNVSLNFEEISDNGIKPFVNVDVYCNDSIIYNGGLTEIMNGNPITFAKELYNDQETLLKIIYKMPVETGNEAQDTTASFYIRLKIEKI